MSVRLLNEGYLELNDLQIYGDSSSNTVQVGAYLTATRVYNAVWNDIADAITVDPDVSVEPGYCYIYDGQSHRKSNAYGEKGVLGINSDTAGYVLGYHESENQLLIAIGGFVLAHVDKIYESGTPLTCTTDGLLTEATPEFIREFPYRIVATFYKVETGEDYKGIPVNGRHWVKVN